MSGYGTTIATAIIILSLLLSFNYAFSAIYDSQQSYIDNQDKQKDDTVDISNIKFEGKEMIIYDGINITAIFTNTGSKILDVDDSWDVFVGNVTETMWSYIPSKNRNLIINQTQDQFNPGLWDPFEDLIIEIPGNYNTTHQFQVKLASDHGIIRLVN